MQAGPIAARQGPDAWEQAGRRGIGGPTRRDHAIEAIDEAITRFRADLRATERKLIAGEWVEVPVLRMTPEGESGSVPAKDTWRALGPRKAPQPSRRCLIERPSTLLSTRLETVGI